jgi:hypothetical protein
MTDQNELLRQYYAEFDRIGISDEARQYFGVSGSLEGAIQELQAFPTGLGTDGFWRRTTGVDFATWRRNLEAEMESGLDAT